MASEKRLIDVNDAIERVRYSDNYVGTSIWESAEMVEFLKSCPAVDAVEVVRCEKCLYRSQYADENGNYKCGGIQTEDGSLALMVKPDFFCAYGERKKDGE